MQEFIRGVRLVYGTKSLRHHVWKPLLLAVSVVIALLITWLFVATTFLTGWVGGLIHWAEDASFSVTLIAAIVLSIILFNPLFLVVASIVSGMRWERLSLECEEFVTSGPVLNHRFSWASSMADLLRRLPISLGAGLIATIMGFVGLGWLGAGLVGLAMTFDVTGPAFARRGVQFPGQVGPTFQCRPFVGFWICCWLASLFPVVGVLLLPAMVAGGTLMVAERYPSAS